MDSQNSSNLIHPPICIEMNDSSFIELRDGGNFLEPKCSPEVFKIIGRESPGSSNTELRHVDKKNQASAALAQLLTCQAVELKLCLAVGDPFSPKLFPVHYGDGLSGQNFGPMMAVLRNMAKPSILLPVWSSFMVNTVTNPKGRFNRYLSPPEVVVNIQGTKTVNHDTEVTKDTMPPANNGSTEDVQPPVVQIQSRNPNLEPIVACSDIVVGVAFEQDHESP
ncbi:hypothetical protein Tco_1183393 [Tanacetum coccineum]